MSTTRRTFLQTAAATPLAGAAGESRLDPVAIARRHAIVSDIPTPNFFEGMLLGNGDIGVCVTVRPDAFGLHIGKLDVWDIRVSEDHVKHLLPFDQILKLWGEAGNRAKQAGQPDQTQLESRDSVLRPYYEKVRSSYAKPWPRPWPCGILWLHWDSRKMRVLKQRLDISNGIYTLELEHDDLRGSITTHTLVCFVNWHSGHISLSCETALPIVSAAYYPHTDKQAKMPLPNLAAEDGAFSCSQLLPATAPGEELPEPPPSPDDRTFALACRLAGSWSAAPATPNRIRVFLKSEKPQPLRLDLTLFTTLEHPEPLAHARTEAARLSRQPLGPVRGATEQAWAEFWSRSAVELRDRELESIWYRNQYFLACCLREGKIAPGLFGNWSSGNIGTAWHGDYHMNYNTQQVFWGVFSSNHIEQHLPYVKLVENLMPMAEWNAKEQFNLPGAYFPHSAYPVPSKVNPYPVPPWGYEICETPWTVQSLWWHYQYTLDKDYLKRVYPILKAASDFLAAFLKQGADGKYHVIPTVSPENWGMTVDFRLNRDCIIDLALTEFVLDATVEAAEILNADSDARGRWSSIRKSLAPYPTGQGPHGKVWLDVTDAPLEWVYNVPVTLSPVFPADQVGLDRNTEMLDIARRTVRTVRLEGGNDLVWQPLARARLGMLDLDWFKREVRYCLLPNGVANDRTRQIDGRYRDETNTDFMMRMGIWTENLSLPAVLNECMMQSCSGVIRLFPNTKNLGPASFQDLRAMGAFLVSASWDGKVVTRVRIHSLKGADARVVSPWKDAKVICQAKTIRIKRNGNLLEFATESGKTYDLRPV